MPEPNNNLPAAKEKKILLTERISNKLEINKPFEVDKNIASNSLFTSTKYPHKTRTIDRVFNNPDGSTNISKIILGDPKHDGVVSGVLNTFDCKILFILIKFFYDAGMPTDTGIAFPLSYIAKELGNDPSGKMYHYIRESLNRLRFVPIRWENIYIAKDEKKKSVILNNLTFTILSDLKGEVRYDIDNKTETKRYTSNLNYVEFNKHIIGNILSGVTTPVIIDVIKALDKDISILLYMYLNTELMDKPASSFFTKDIAKIIGLSDYAYAKERLRKIEPALKELIGKPIANGIIRNYKAEQSGNRNDIVITVYKKESGSIEQPLLPPKPSDYTQVVEYFNKTFPAHKGTLEFYVVQKHSAQYSVADMTRYLDYMKAQDNINTIKKPAAYFNNALIKKYNIGDIAKQILIDSKKIDDIKSIEDKLASDQLRLEAERKETDYYLSIYNGLASRDKACVDKRAMELLKKDFNNKTPEIIPRPLLHGYIKKVLIQDGHKYL